MYALRSVVHYFAILCLATHETPVPFENLVDMLASHSRICGKKIAAVSLVNILFYLLKYFIMELPQKKKIKCQRERTQDVFRYFSMCGVCADLGIYALTLMALR